MNPVTMVMFVVCLSAILVMTEGTRDCWTKDVVVECVEKCWAYLAPGIYGNRHFDWEMLEDEIPWCFGKREIRKVIDMIHLLCSIEGADYFIERNCL